MARRGRELGVAFYRPGMGMRSASAAERGAGDEAGQRPARALGFFFLKG